MEIYNETIRDLLGEKDSNLKHEVKLAGPNTTEVIVTNLKTMPVERENQVHQPTASGNMFKDSKDEMQQFVYEAVALF